MLPSILIALLVQATAPASSLDPASIPSLKQVEIERCAPKSISDALSCISQSLDGDVLEDIAGSTRNSHRAAYEALLRASWKLDDPSSPVAAEMVKRKVYNPNAAAGILLADMNERLSGRRFDYVRLSNEMTAKGANKPQKAATATTAAAVTPGALPIERCKQKSDPADLRITGCQQNADGTMTRTLFKPAAAPPPPVPGALPEGIAAGSVSVALELCKSSSPLPAGTMLKACWKQPDGRFARQAVRDPNAPKN